MLPKPQESIYIQSFKHDGSLHRTWAKGYVMEEYIDGIKKNPLAYVVKAADRLHNLRSALVTDNDMVVLYSGPQKEGLTNPTQEEILGAIALAKAAEIQPLEGENVNEPLLDANALKGSPVVLHESAKFGATKLALANGIEIYIKPTDFKKDEVMIKVVGNGGKSILPTELLPSLERNVLMKVIRVCLISLLQNCRRCLQERLCR